MTAYFEECHVAGYAPTTLRGRFSALKKFWLHTARGDLSMEATLIESNLGKWDKMHTIKQACVFTKENFGKCVVYFLIYIHIHTY